MKCQSLFSWNSEKNISLFSAELAKRVVKIKEKKTMPGTGLNMYAVLSL